jgi:hypothetical protein
MPLYQFTFGFEILLKMLPPLISYVAGKISEKLTQETPIIVETDGIPKLQPPDKRLSWAITKREGQFAVCLLVEQNDTWAARRAEVLQAQYKDEVTLTVAGVAHSSKVEEPVQYEKQAQLSPGLSIGHIRGYPGTLGCIVRVNSSSKDYLGIISASHVLAINNTAEIGDPVLHPGYPDGPRVLTSRVGVLDNFTYLVHHQKDPEDDNEGSEPSNTEDVAVVKLDDQQRCPQINWVPNPKDPDRRIQLKGHLSIDETIRRIAEPVYKVGRTSKFTKGILEHAVVHYPIRLPDRKVYVYKNIFDVSFTNGEAFSQPGDSGSIVYTSDGKAVGLIIGGSHKYSFVSPISSCLSAVNASLLS